MKLRMFAVLLMVFLVGCNTSPTEAQNNVHRFESGIHYDELERPLPQGVAPIVEFFYYGCRACYQLSDTLAVWSKESGIQVSLVPVHTDKNLVDAARFYHTLAELGQLQDYKAGYVLFQTRDSALEGKARVNYFLQQRGISVDRFWQAWSSGVVNRRMAGSLMLTRIAGVASTPAFVVQGRYRVEPSVIESVDELLSLLEYLIAIPRVDE